MQWLGVAHADVRSLPGGDVLDRPQAKSIGAKLAQTSRATESARLDTSPQLVDKLEHFESEDDVRLLARMDRHAEVA
jgi:hypothetical protein